MTEQYLSLLSKILGAPQALSQVMGRERHALLSEHLAQAAALKHLCNASPP